MLNMTQTVIAHERGVFTRPSPTIEKIMDDAEKENRITDLRWQINYAELQLMRRKDSNDPRWDSLNDLRDKAAVELAELMAA